MMANLRQGGIAALLLAAASPAIAQWTSVVDVPTTRVFSVWANGNTILATADSVVYISANAGATWKPSAKVAAGVQSVTAARLRNGRIYAGTYGQGVFVSDDMGDTWAPYNQGLTGGVLDTQLFIQDLFVRGDSLYAATGGDGPWVRDLTTGSWHHFGDVFEPNQASNMNAVDGNGTRLLACVVSNGNVFFRDPGDADWTLSWLDNVGLRPSWTSYTSIWTGSGWVVGSNVGVFHSPAGQSPWTRVDMGLGPLNNVSIALRAPVLFGSFVTAAISAIEYSTDNGATWQLLDVLPSIFIFKLATEGNTLYAARTDGLWRRDIATVQVKSVTWGSVKGLFGKPRK